MAKFYFNPENNLIVINNVSHKGETFYVEENNGNLIINIITANTLNNRYYHPLIAVISIKNNIVNVYGALKLIKWNNENYDVIYELPKFNYYSPPVALAQDFYNLRGSQHTVTVYRDSIMRLLCECDTKASAFDIDYNLSDIKILLQPTSLGFLIILIAKTDTNHEYLNLILYDGKYNQLFEDTADEISFAENSFKITKKAEDMLGRVYHKTYTFSNGNFIEAENVFTYRHEKEYPDELIPYLFLEALKANDTNRATSYLSEDLVEMLPHFKEFFGEFTKIECPKYSKNNTKNGLLTVALLDDLKAVINTPKLYTFQYADSKITNVTD